tara:strand:- start:365 stop:565 length:201 start_codon:yes stop_codon:yes gene_type:complete
MKEASDLRLENDKLRELVKEAYREGYADAVCRSRPLTSREHVWNKSDARKKLTALRGRKAVNDEQE